MILRDFDAQQARGAADIAERFERSKIELRRERFEVQARQAGHGVEENLQFGRVGIELLEDALLLVPGLVLWLAGAEPFRQVVPESKQPHVEHGEDSADVTRAFGIQIHRASRNVEVAACRTVAVAFEKLHRHERVEEIRDPASVEAEFTAEFRPGETAIAELGEDAHLDGSKEDLRVPEGEGRLENGRWIDGSAHALNVGAFNEGKQAGRTL